MLNFSNIWCWILFKNPDGLAVLITIWLLGVVYGICGLVGLIDNANYSLVLKYCFFSGAGIFIAMPLLKWIFKNR
jgi:hypothetical protein